MNGGIGVGASNGLLQRRQQVIVVIPLPVRPQGAFLGDRLGILQRQGEQTALGNPGGEQHLHRIHGLAQVTAASAGNVFQCARLRLCCQAGALLHVGNRPLHRLQGGRCRNLLELKHGGAAEDGVEHIKVGIFRGGGNQGYFPVFNVFQQGLLLLFIKGLNLVQIQQHPVGCHKGVQLGHNLFDVSSGSCGGIKLI